MLQAIRPEGWLFSVLTGVGVYWLLFGIMAAATFSGMALFGSGIVDQMGGADPGTTSPASDLSQDFSDETGQTFPWFALLVLWTGQAFFGRLTISGDVTEDGGSAAGAFHMAGPNITGFMTAAVLLFVAGRLVERFWPSAGNAQRWIQSVVTGLLLMLFVLFMPVFAQLTFSIDDDTSVHAHSVSFMATVVSLAVGVLASYAGRRGKAPWAPTAGRVTVVAGEVARTVGVFAKHALFAGGIVTIVAFIVLAVKANAKIALGLFLLRPLDFVADSFTFVLMGGMHMGVHGSQDLLGELDLDDLTQGRPELVGNLTGFNIPTDTPTWWVPIVLAVLLIITCILASVHRLAVMNRSAEHPVGIASWLILPLVYLALAGIGFFVLRIGVDIGIRATSEDLPGGRTQMQAAAAFRPTWWIVLTAPAVGLIVEVLARFVAPRIAGAFSPTALTVLAARPVAYPAVAATARPAAPTAPTPPGWTTANTAGMAGATGAAGGAAAAAGAASTPGFPAPETPVSGTPAPHSPASGPPPAGTPAPGTPAGPGGASPTPYAPPQQSAPTPPPATPWPGQQTFQATPWPGQHSYQASQAQMPAGLQGSAPGQTASTAPAQPTPWSPEQKRKAKKYGLGALVVVVVLALIGTGTGIYLSSTAKSREAKTAAQSYLTALKDGDGDKLQSLDAPSGGDSAKEGLDPEVYSGAGDKITDSRITGAKRADGGYAVSAKITQGGKERDVTVGLKQEDDDWKIASGVARKMVIAVPGGTDTLEVNGKKLTYDEQVLDADTSKYIKDTAKQDPDGWHQLTLLLYPGKYEISSPKENSYFQNGISGVEVAADGQGSALRTHFKRELSDYFKEQAVQTINDTLSENCDEYSTSAENCPFTISKSKVSDYAGAGKGYLGWTVTKEPDYEDPVLKNDGTAYFGTKTSLQGTVSYPDTSNSYSNKDRAFEAAFEANFTVPDDSSDTDDDDDGYGSDYSESDDLQVTFKKVNTSFP